MTGPSRVVGTPAFEREFRKVSRGNAALAEAFSELLTVLEADPHNRSGTHQIKKLAGMGVVSRFLCEYDKPTDITFA